MSDQTPEAIPTPSVPATPATPTPAPTDIIDAVFAFAALHANNPIEQMAVSYAKSYATTYKTQLAGLIGMSGVLTVRGVVDTMFTFVEGKAQRPFVKLVLKGLNVLVDDVGLPVLQTYLLTLGIILPLA